MYPKASKKNLFPKICVRYEEVWKSVTNESGSIKTSHTQFHNNSLVLLYICLRSSLVTFRHVIKKLWKKMWSLQKASRQRSMEERHERIGINRDLPYKTSQKVTFCSTIASAIHHPPLTCNKGASEKNWSYQKASLLRSYGSALTNRDQWSTSHVPTSNKLTSLLYK